MSEAAACTLPFGRIDLWLMDPAAASSIWVERSRQSLMPNETARASEFVFDHLRHDYFCTRIMQRQVLSRYVDIDPAAWRFAAGPQGKPCIVAPEAGRPIRFSISHTQGLIALALGRGAEVGVDIEGLDPVIDVAAMAVRFFAPLEAAALLALGEDGRRLRFFQLWTLKEACLKALGTGLSAPVDAVSFDFRSGTPVAIEGEGQWRVETARPTSEHVLGLAVLETSGVVREPGLSVETRWFRP